MSSRNLNVEPIVFSKTPVPGTNENQMRYTATVVLEVGITEDNFLKLYPDDCERRRAELNALLRVALRNKTMRFFNSISN